MTLTHGGAPVVQVLVTDYFGRRWLYKLTGRDVKGNCLLVLVWTRFVTFRHPRFRPDKRTKRPGSAPTQAPQSGRISGATDGAGGVDGGRDLEPGQAAAVDLDRLEDRGQFGHAMAGVKTWSWLHALGFALFITLAVYVILDIEFPRAGFVRLSAFDEVLVELRDSMK